MILETPKGIEDGEDLDARNLRVLAQLVRPAAPSPQTRLSRPGPLHARSLPRAVSLCRWAATERRLDKTAAECMVMPTTQVNGQVVTVAHCGGDARSPASRSELVHQSRAELARFQRASARRGARPVQSAAGPAPVPGDLRIEPRRVFRGPRRRAPGPALREPRAARPAPRRHGPTGSTDRDHPPRARFRRPHVRGLAHRDPPAAAQARHSLCARPGADAPPRTPFSTTISTPRSTPS